MSGVVDIYGTTPRLGRRSMALADIDPKYVSQSGIWEASEVETSRGSIRIQHLTAVSAGPRPLSCSVTSGSVGPLSHGANSRFPKLEECAHFHYDVLELPPLKLSLRSEEPLKSGSSGNSCGSGDEIGEKYTFSIEVVSGGQCWAIRRTHANLCKLDEQLHRCVWDRSFSQLAKVNDSENEDESEEEHDECRALIERYLDRLSELPTNQITCGSVLSFFEIDNRGRHIVSTDDSAINTPAVAAACAVRKYVAQAADELSFEVGDMISVIDMPPPEESIWWRGKRKFHVGFFPRECVQVIGEKVPMGLPIVPSTRKLQRLSVSSNASSADSSAPEKPVLRKHGKLIAFFRSFILSRPSRRTLKQSGILRERVFGCDLAEHLLNTGTDIPVVLKCCSEFIESHGIVDGIYRLSGITSNIQKLRITFDEGRIPNLEEDNAIKQDIHAVSSLLKMYFRDLPNPLCTYQLYEKFVAAAQASDSERLFRMREVAQQLPPPHFRTLEYLLKHLARVADNSNQTGMTPKNMAIVWAPNLIRCKELEAGGVAALKGIGVQAVVTEYLVRHADLIFSDKLTVDFPETTSVISNNSPSGRPKSLAISSPMRLMSLEEAQDKAKDDRKYIDVGGGPANLPPKYHTVIDIPGRRSSMKSKRTPTGWKHFFSRNRSFSKPPRKDITVVTKSTPPVVQQGLQANWGNRLRPVKSVESLVSSPLYQSSTCAPPSGLSNTIELDESVEEVEIHNHNIQESQSSPVSPVTGIVEVQVEPEIGMNHSHGHDDSRPLQNSKTHNRSISHDSYFEFGEFLKKNGVYIDETLEEENSQTESKDSLEDSSEMESPRKERSSGAFGDCESMASPRNTNNRVSFGSPMTPPASIPSLRLGLPTQSIGSGMQSSSSEEFNTNSHTPQHETDENETVLSKSPLLKPKPRYSLLRHMECQTSMTKLTDIGVSTMEDGDFNHSVSVVTKDSIGINTDEVFPTTTFKEIGEKFELDRNSSVDDSSTDTTPGGDNYALTNIIYSPLINDMSSCSASASAASPASSMEKLYGNSDKIPGLFICPLYEAGVESGDSGPAASAPHKSYRTRIHQYENLGTIMDSFSDDESEPVTVQSASAPVQVTTEIQTESLNTTNTYENERLYQNDEFQQSQISIVKLEGPMSTSPDEEDRKEEGQEDEGQNFYENWNGQDQGEEENNYETVIYEDVGNEKEEGDDEEQHCYETIEVATAAAKQLGEALAASTANATNQEPKPDPDEEESAYEDVRFVYLSKKEVGQLDKPQSVPEPVPVVHDLPQNAEIRSSPEITKQIVSPNQESSGSPSYTDDMVTYLEIGSTNDNDNIRLKLRNNSIEEESLRIPVQSSFSSDGSPSSEENPEIRHIDSPLVVDNPLYGLQLEEQMQNGNGNYESNRKPLEKLIVRCNSAPAADETATAAGRDFALELAIRTLNAVKNVNQNENNIQATGDPAKLLPLFKRMSEPSLLSNDKSTTATAWKASDAKRLTHRKSSVKELLSKFEPKEGLSPSPSPTHSTGSVGGPGLPRPDSRSSTLRHKNSNNNGQRFQHHRFSMGDILMTQSMSSADDGNGIGSDVGCGGGTTMIRSDTFPELRTDSSKENGICGGNGNSLESGSCSDRDNYGDCESSSVAEKVHHALRVAMSSVDMNDPSRRERIEKYKEERRIFLRQKISSELTDPPPTPKPSLSLSSPSDSAKCSILSLKSPDRTSFSSIDNDSVFQPPDDQKKFNSSSSMESPRKRAFSEDVSPGSGSLNQSVTKSIKTEEREEINVREKVAAWTTSERRIYSHSTSTSFMELGSPGRSGTKPELKEAMSLPIEGFESSANSSSTTTPKHQLLFRRDYSPSASLEITKTKLISSSRTSGGGTTGDSGNGSGNNGKKIKDIAAFFERKGF